VDADNNIWVGGTNTAHEQVNGVTGQPVPGTQFNLGCGGYGGFIDRNQVLWSARFGSGLLRYDTRARTGRCLGNGNGDYGLGSDPKTGHIWHTQLFGNRVVKLDSAGNLLGRFGHTDTGPGDAQGVAVDGNGNVWVAHSLLGSTTVGHIRTDGTLVGDIPLLGSVGPTGVAVDGNGKVWSTNYISSTVSRIDPAIGPVGGGGFPTGWVDLTVALRPDSFPYNHSDMTGFVAIGSTSPQGLWSIVQDGGSAGFRWGRIIWNMEAPRPASPRAAASS
jgi:sugar lactone lactonase YvrE